MPTQAWWELAEELPRSTHCGWKGMGSSGSFWLQGSGFAHNLAGRGSSQGWTTSKPEGDCHSPDLRVGIQQCWRDLRTIRDVGSLHLFLGKENQQRSRLKSCHPIWQRLHGTIPDIYGYADWEATAPRGWERGDHILMSGAGG